MPNPPTQANAGTRQATVDFSLITDRNIQNLRKVFPNIDSLSDDSLR